MASWVDSSTEKTGRVDIHFSCLNDDYEKTKYLIKQGCNLNVRDKDGWTPIFFCESYKTAKLLLDNGALPDISCESPVFGSYNPIYWSVIENKRGLFSALLDHGVSVNNTCFYDCDLYDLNEDGVESISQACCRKNDSFFIKTLYLSGFKLPDNEDLLHISTSNNCYEICKFLVDVGFDPLKLNENEVSSLDIAKQNKFSDIISLFESSIISESIVLNNKKDKTRL